MVISKVKKDGDNGDQQDEKDDDDNGDQQGEKGR